MFSCVFLSETCFPRKSVALHKHATKPGILCACLSVVLGFGCSFGYIFALRVSIPECVPSSCGRLVEPRRKGSAVSATGSALYLTAPFKDESWGKSCAFRKLRQGDSLWGFHAFNRRLDSEFYWGTRAQARSRGRLQSKGDGIIIVGFSSLERAWDVNFGFIFFFIMLWMLIPDKTVISKIGFVDFSKVFNFSSPEPNGSIVRLHFCVGWHSASRAHPSL